jgi:hypothetical protein
MRKLLLLLLSVSFVASVSAQYDSTKLRQTIGAYGFDWKNAKFITSSIQPTDTVHLAVADSGAIAIKNGNIWAWNGYRWVMGSYTKNQVDSLLSAAGVNTYQYNHIISGGVVTYSGSGLTYLVSSCQYIIGGVYYTSPATTITLDPADATNPRIDLFAVDTNSVALKITGIAASTPITPQVDPASQLALTTGITLNPNDTVPTGTTSTLIYDENTEWTTGGTATVDFNNTAQPYHGTKDAYVSSYSKGSTLTFTTTTQTVDNSKTLRAFIRLNNSNYSFQFQFFNGTTAVSNIITASVNNSLFGSYQNVSIPLSSFTWSGTAYDKIIISMTGHGATGTYYIDYISLEGGTPVIPPVDNSNKVDSVTRISNSYYYWTKGVKHLISLATDSTAYHTIGQASDYFTLNTLDGRKDTVSFPKDTQYVKNPLYSDNDTLKFHSDSLTSVLKYSGIDSSAYDDNTLIPKGYLNDRIAEVTATGITRSELQDTAIAIRSAIPLQFNPIAGANVTLSGIYPNITFNSTASGATNSNIGSGYRLAVPFTNNIKTIFAVSPLGIDSVSNSNALTFTFDTSLYHSTAWNNVNYGSLSQQNTNTSNIASNTTAIAGKLSNITGLVTPGTNVIVAGSGTSGSPYVISSTGGGTSQLDWYYPESYGAKADSSTLNARAFQAMIDAMPVRGGKVHLSSGVYLFGDTTIRIDKPIMFEGNGMVDALNKVTTLITTYNRAMFNVVEDNVTFKDLTINDLQSSTPTSGSVGIKADSNYRSHQYIVGLTLQNVTVNGFFNNVEATGTVFFRFSNCRFSGIFNYGVDVANRFIPDAGDSYITGCTFLPSSSNAVAAIHQLNSGGLRITNCKFNWHTTTGWFNYNYLADSISGTSDLFTGMSSLENYKVSAIKIKKLPTGSFSLVNINNNEFGDFQNATAPAIDINGISNINIVGNTFSKGTIDTAIKMTSVTSSNILGNTYSSSYGVPVYYSGTNTNISGEGVALGTKNLLAKFTDSVHIGNSVFQDSSSVAAINLRAVTGGYVPNYISDGSIGQSKLSIVSSANSGTSEVSFINSNTAGLGGFSLWKQTGATSSTNLLTIKANGNSGFGGIVSPVAYVDIPAGTGSGSTGQIHLAPGKATNSDGYLSYDTAIGGKHLYFNIGGTQYRLDSQVVSGGGGTPLLADGSVPLTANWNVGNHNITAIASLSATTISAGSSITSNNTISANGAVSGTSFTSTQFNGGSGTLTGLLLRDFSQATSSVTAQNSLMAVWQGYVWNGTASQEVDYRAGVFPIGGTSTSEWKLSTSLAAGAYSDVLKVKNDGRVTLSNVINLKAYTVATLPTGTVGDVAYVTDASSPTALATVSGGGSTTVMVFYNGTNWIVP